MALKLQVKFGKRWYTQQGTFSLKKYKELKKQFGRKIRIKP